MFAIKYCFENDKGKDLDGVTTGHKRDMMDQSHHIYALTGTNHAQFMFHFAVARDKVY